MKVFRILITTTIAMTTLITGCATHRNDPGNASAPLLLQAQGSFAVGGSVLRTEGFQTLFLGRGFPVYLVDQPRRGRAGNSTVAATVEPTPNDQLFFDQFRIGKSAGDRNSWQYPLPDVRPEQSADRRPRGEVPGREEAGLTTAPRGMHRPKKDWSSNES